MVEVWTGFEFGNPDAPYSELGDSPELVTKLISWLRDMRGTAASLDLAMYLFNNAALCDALKELSRSGCRVTVYTIPPEGYDDGYAMQIVDHTDGSPLGKFTKLSYAEPIFRELTHSAPENFELRFVPHMYLRSSKVRPFSRGNMPYSLHCKTLFMQGRDGTAYAGVTSSNMAVRDKEKIELASVTMLTDGEAEAARDFFAGLRENSVAAADFDAEGDYAHFETKLRTAPESSALRYIAPFYVNSASDMEGVITSLVRGAKKRVLICAQHIAVNGGTGEPEFLNEAINKAGEGVKTTFISQTYCDAEGSHGCRTPQNKAAFIEFAETAKAANCQYYVNPNLHAKLIVADDTAVITTCNFTPTQFIYLGNVNIPKFERIPGFSYSGVFCEYGVYSIVENCERTMNILRRLAEVTRLPDTVKAF